ncbi:MAG: RICIN domain-containing protein [Clostridia bacterium]|nr:RICIN domain-containing protein [Clostridia bacterium]
MKKFLSAILVLCMIFSVTAAFAAGEDVKIVIDGEELIPTDAFGRTVSPIIENGSTFLPVRAIAKALNVSISWDGATKTVFIGSTGGNPSLGDNVNIFIDGAEFIAKDEAGSTVYPVLLNGTTYLPVRAIATAFGMSVAWDNATRTVTLTSPEPEKVDEAMLEGAATVKAGASFAIRNAKSGKYISITSEAAGSATAFSDTPVAWLLESVSEEHYQIVYGASSLALDVNGVSTAAGGNIIVWDKSGADNQLFAFTRQADGTYTITIKHSQLNVDTDGTQLIQNRASTDAAQRWVLVNTDAPVATVQATTATAKSGEKVAIKNVESGKYVSAASSSAGAATTFADTPAEWLLTSTGDGHFQIFFGSSNYAWDVSGASTESGGALIIWDKSGDDNQCFKITEDGNGTYTITAKHSQLNVGTDNSQLIQETASSSKTQRWTLEKVSGTTVTQVTGPIGN